MSYRIVRMHLHQIRRQLIAYSEKKSLYTHTICASSDDFSAEIAKKEPSAKRKQKADGSGMKGKKQRQ